MKIRFQADNDFNHLIIKAILRREPTIDFKTALSANLSGSKDEDVLLFSAEEHRLLVTHDRKTIPHHFANFIKAHQSPGVLIIPQKYPIANAADEIILIWLATEAEEWTNRIHILPL